MELGFNWLDWALLALLLLSSVLGLISGVTGSVLRVGVVILSFLVALRYGDEVSVRLADTLKEEWMANLAGYLGLFFLVLVGGGAIVEILRKALKLAGLGGIDRFGGMLFGLLRAYLIIVVVFYGLSFTPLMETRPIQESKTAFAFILGSKWISQHFGSELQAVQPFLDGGAIEQKLDPAVGKEESGEEKATID